MEYLTECPLNKKVSLSGSGQDYDVKYHGLNGEWPVFCLYTNGTELGPFKVPAGFELLPSTGKARLHVKVKEFTKDLLILECLGLVTPRNTHL